MRYGLSAEEIEWLADVYRMFREGDPAFLDRFAPDVKCSFPATLPAGGEYTGAFEALQFWNTIGELFEDAHVEAEEYLRVADRVVVIGTWSARAPGSGEEIASRFIHLMQMSGGGATLIGEQVVSFELFIDTAQAVQALE